VTYLGVAGIFACLVIAPALAGSIDDFNKGVSAINRDDADAAIRYLSAALTAGDLLPSLQSTAYLDRGIAYVHKRMSKEALSDFNAAITLNPKLVDAYWYRFGLYIQSNQIDSALRDCTALSALEPLSADAPRACGMLSMKVGRFGEAAVHFADAFDIDHDLHRPYLAIWLAVAQLKNGAPDIPSLARRADALDLYDWPKPILNLFLGRTDPEAVLLAAQKGDEPTQKNQRCEAAFYVGEWQLAYGHTAEAKALFQQAVDTCPKDFVELAPATAELKKLQ
jgi:lipoprotein NlpI